MIVAGDVLAGRYSVKGLLARGGMADVHRGHDSVADRWVAVKAFRADAGDTTDLRRFERETRLLARLDHRNLVRLLDAGHYRGVPYLVLELVEGPTLTQRLHQGPLPSAQAQQVARDLARALAHVHAQRVVHRDVKPSNILLAPDGRALLSDFGIAKLADDTRLTAARTTIGTAAYLAPEQIGGGETTGAADVYALGLVLIEALSGQRPFDGSQHEMLAARMTQDPYIPPVVSPSWARLLRAMTRRDPTARPVPTVIAAHLAMPPPSEAPVDLAVTEELVDEALPEEVIAAPPGGDDISVAGRPRHARPAGTPARPSPAWLAALVPLVLLVGFLFTSTGNPDPASSGSATSSTTITPSTTAASTTTSTPAPTTTVASPPAPPAMSLAQVCADLDAQRQAIEDEKQRVDEAYRGDPDTRETLKDQLKAQKEAIDAQKRALGC
jgi:serine/threonine protein kinase